MAELHFLQLDSQLSFADGAFPLIVDNAARVSSLEGCEAWIKRNLADLEHALSRAGALLFRGFPLASAKDFDRFSAAFGYKNFTYQESLSNAVRINYTERVFTANEAPKDVEIYLHHEMAQTPIYPSKLFFFCQSAAEQGGATPLCRSDKLYEALKARAPELAAEFAGKGIKYTTVMPAEDDPQSGQGRSWQSTLSVSGKEGAEAKLKELGYTWRWYDNGCLEAVTPVLPAVVTLDDGREVFFNQLIAAYLGWQGVYENPQKAIIFGDGSAIPKKGLDLVVTLAAQFTFDLPWQDGDVALVDNYLTMHGRRRFAGDRKRVVLVALAAA